jgi:hypothetical protein
MRKFWVILLLAVVAAFAGNIKLYLKDGGYQLVREYQVQTDRVRYYSVERSQWEEIPLDLVDLKRTQTEVSERQEALDKESKMVDEEAAAERAVQKEVSRIPQDPGVYWLEGGATKVMKAGEVQIHNDKRRMVLQKLTGPFLNGKSTLEMNGAHSPNVLTNPEQEFYIQLAEPEQFGIIKLASNAKTGVRIVENITTSPVVKDLVEEERTMVAMLQRQLGNDLYKIWPKEKMEPGEYAVVEFTDGKVNIQVYDFAIKAK